MTEVKMKIKGATQTLWKNPDKEKLLRILEELRKKIEAGEVIDHFEIIREIDIP